MNNKSKLDEWIGNAALLGWRIKNFKNAVIHSLGIMNGNIYDGIIKIVTVSYTHLTLPTILRV